jgi:hypothetical protein
VDGRSVMYRLRPAPLFLQRRESKLRAGFRDLGTIWHCLFVRPNNLLHGSRPCTVCSHARLSPLFRTEA